MWMREGNPVVLNRDVMLTASPKRQKRGLSKPITPAATAPEKLPSSIIFKKNITRLANYLNAFRFERKQEDAECVKFYSFEESSED